MIRRLVAGLILVGLAVGIWALWPRGDSDTLPTTLPTAVETIASATTLASTTRSTSLSSTTSEGGAAITVEEAETILRDLWFGWFEGIYNQDEERIREVVGTQSALEDAQEAFGSMEFERPPQIEDVSVHTSEVLKSDDSCLVVLTTVDLEGFRVGSSTAVHVLRPKDDRWVSVGLWSHREDLWEQDCEGTLESF